MVERFGWRSVLKEDGNAICTYLLLICINGFIVYFLNIIVFSFLHTVQIRFYILSHIEIV